MNKLILILLIIVPSHIFGQKVRFTIIEDVWGIRWCTENLTVTKFRNGTPLFHAKNIEELQHATMFEIPAYINLDLDKSNFKKYGYLYNGYAVFNSQGLIPKGYRLPTEGDYLRLYPDEFVIYPEFNKIHRKRNHLYFYLSGTQDPFGGAVGMGNYANLWLMPDSVKFKDYRKAITIINEENWEPESTTDQPIWATDAHLQNFYFVRCIEDSLNAHPNNDILSKPMRSSIDLYNESYNYYDLLICDTLLFDVSDLVIYESSSTSNKEKIILKNIKLKNIINYYDEGIFVNLDYIDRKSLIKLAKEKVVIVYSEEYGLRWEL